MILNILQIILKIFKYYIILYNQYLMDIIINSNTCVGWDIYKKFNLEYTSPLIASLIPNDIEYLKLIKNFKNILNDNKINISNIPKKNTIFEIQNNYPYYKHEIIKVPYPIIKIDDIDIHFIHETELDLTYNKFIRRIERCKNIIKNNNYKILNILIFTEIINDTNNYEELIESFLSNNDISMQNIFLGPEKYKIVTDNIKNIYISHEYFNNISTDRNSSHIMLANSQEISSNILYNFINENYYETNF